MSFPQMPEGADDDHSQTNTGWGGFWSAMFELVKLVWAVLALILMLAACGFLIFFVLWILF